MDLNEFKEDISNQANNIKIESKNWFLKNLNQYKKPIILVLVGIASIFLIIYGFSSGKDYVTGIINNMVNLQMKTIDENYTSQLKLRDEQLQNIQRQLSTSEKLSLDIKKRVN